MRSTSNNERMMSTCSGGAFAIRARIIVVITWRSTH
jgi:hypothetical protein